MRAFQLHLPLIALVFALGGCDDDISAVVDASTHDTDVAETSNEDTSVVDTNVVETSSGDTVVGDTSTGDTGLGDDTNVADTTNTSSGDADVVDTSSDAVTPAADPGERGILGVHLTPTWTTSIDDDDLNATICAPSLDGGATPDDAPRPLVVLSPGFLIPRAQYQGACEHLASWGFLVLLQDYAFTGGFSTPPHDTLADETSALITLFLADPTWGPRADAARVATVGHSLGGKVSVLTAIEDARIGAVVGWDPVDALPPIPNGSTSVAPEQMAGLTVPFAAVGETLDATGQGFGPACAPEDDNYVAFAEAACASSDVLEVTVAGADHVDWAEDPATCGFSCFACKAGALDDAVTRTITARVTTAFLRHHLLADASLDAWLAPPLVGAAATVRRDPCAP